MKLLLMLPVSALAAVALVQTPAAAQKPLDEDQIMSLVAAKMDNVELARRVHDRGIDFDLTEDYLQALRKAGAQDVLIKALRAVKPKPLTREQVLQLILGGVPSPRAVTLVNGRGIDFLADEKYLDTLRVAGAEEALITAVRQASEAATAEMVVVTSPNAEVYLDGALQGRANAQGQLSFKSKLGSHALKVSLEGKKDFERNFTVVVGQANKFETPLEDIGPAVGEARVNPKDGLKYVWIPPGSFMMGCSLGDSDCKADEKPAHQVTISRGFWMGQTEVTVGAYKRFSNAEARRMPSVQMPENPGWSKEQMPIEFITWGDANSYCRWVGGRLPTEAEWEYAARGGSAEARYGTLDEVAWFYPIADSRNHDVAQKRANRFGLFDVLGNVNEFVSDWWGGKVLRGFAGARSAGTGERRIPRPAGRHSRRRVEGYSGLPPRLYSAKPRPRGRWVPVRGGCVTLGRHKFG